jgi:glycosyltransferase involved in cell wall biosynthesis
MKVLLVSLFHPELVRGGAQQVCYELFKGLQSREDVEPLMLAAIDPSFTALYKSGARITGFDGRPGEFLFLSREYDYWWHKTSDVSVRESFAEFLELVRPDVVHFHHFLLLGLDLVTLTRRVLPQARIVFTFHEFLAICAADGQMVRKTDRSLCNRASSVRCHQCFPERRPEEFFMREMWVKRHLACVDVFTTPSKFMIEHYVDWGLDREAIVHVANGQVNYAGGFKDRGDDARRNRFGFFGQFVDNKGLHVLIEAAGLLRDEGFVDFTIEVNGDNLRFASEARRREIEAFFTAEQARPPSEQRVRLNGSYHLDQLGERMSRVDWCVVPSVWWEIFGLVISEAWMFGRPVIASDVGGPAERVRDGVDGLHFAVGDARSLADTIRRAATEEGLWRRLSSQITPPAGRARMAEDFLHVYGLSRSPEALRLSA